MISVFCNTSVGLNKRKKNTDPHIYTSNVDKVISPTALLYPDWTPLLLRIHRPVLQPLAASTDRLLVFQQDHSTETHLMMGFC